MNGGGPTGGALSSSLLYRLAGWVVRHARVVLALWLVAIAALGLKGIGLEDRLSPIHVDKSTDQAERDLMVRAFGDEDALVLMLRGPRPAVDRQGRRLERALDALPRTRVVSPWREEGIVEGLRPDRRTAVAIVTVGRGPGEEYDDVLPPMHDAIERSVRAPVRADLTGSPVIAAAMADAASDATETGVWIALAVLLGVVALLLFAFRSVLAVVPVLVGVTTVAASRGVMDLLSGPLGLNGLATGLATMIGFGLGVGYPLLVISRFREEARRTDALAPAVQATVAATGAALLVAGAGLLLAMLAAAVLMPGPVVASAGLAIATASVLGVAASIVVVPALLALLDPLPQSWVVPSEPVADPGPARWSRRPGLAVATGVLLLVGTALALALDTGPPSARSLPSDDPARAQYEAVERALGPGWGTPLEVMMDGRERPVTEPARLKALADFERRLERDPGVAMVAGLSRVERTTRPLRRVPGQLERLDRELTDSRRRLTHVGADVGREHRRAGEISSGLAGAASEAGWLRSETGRATTGADRVARELEGSESSSERLLDGLDSASDDGDSLARTADGTRTGARPLQQGLAEAQRTADAMPGRTDTLRNALTTGTDHLDDADGRVERAAVQLEETWRALRRMTTAKADPQYQAVLRAVEQASIVVAGADLSTGEAPDGGEQGIGDSVQDAAGEFDNGLYLADRVTTSSARAHRGIGRLVRGADELGKGLGDLAGGGNRLADGLERLRAGGGELTPGLDRLAEGARALAGGLSQVDSGTVRLADGLASGASDSGELVSGLGRAERGVRRQRSSSFKGAGDLDRLQRRAPGLFDSGYFLLASIDQAGRRNRSQAGLLINVDRGGNAARMLVVPTTGPLSDETRDTRERLTRGADLLGWQTESDVIVAGQAVALQEYDEAIRARLPLLLLLLSLITVLVLVPLVRSLVLPLVAAALNALTAGATLGVLSIAFDGSLLGGPGYVDTIGVAALVTAIVGLATGYQAFVLSRMREEYDRTGDTELAIANGLGRTGQAVGASAAVMIALFAAFAISSFASVRSFGVGLAVAVLIDAFLVRLVTLPAVMRLLGERSWWLPAWLDRVLPQAGRRGAARA